MSDTKKLINWGELSRRLTGERTYLRKNRIPGKYKLQINRLIKLIRQWEKEIENVEFLKTDKNMEKYVIMDRTSNTGRCYITESGENTELKENALVFDDHKEAEEYINSKGWEEWAVIREYDEV